MTKEKVTISGNQLVDKIKQLINQGNITRVRLLHDERPLLDIPLTVGVPVAAAAVLTAPVLAALGAIAALVAECTLEIERSDNAPEEKVDTPDITDDSQGEQ